MYNIPLFTNQSHLSLSKECNTNKCSPTKKCPCRTWVNCLQYVDIYEQQKRLKIKENKNKILNNIEKWYEIYYKSNIGIHDLYSTG